MVVSKTETVDAGQESPQLVVVCGLPGVGKTTVADEIVERVDGRLLRTDVIRKEILTDPDYTEEESRRVYHEMFDRARETVENGQTAVLDGTFKDADRRYRAVELAETLDVEFRLVKVECSEDVVRERIRQRTDDASDADYEVHAMFRERFDPISLDHVTVDNSDGMADTYRQVKEAF